MSTESTTLKWAKYLLQSLSLFLPTIPVCATTGWAMVLMHRILSRGLTNHLTQRTPSWSLRNSPSRRLWGRDRSQLRSHAPDLSGSYGSSEAMTRGRYPVVVSSNCMATPTVVCGLSNPGTIDDANKTQVYLFRLSQWPWLARCEREWLLWCDAAIHAVWWELEDVHEYSSWIWQYKPI